MPYRVVVVGAGFGGIGMAIALQAGRHRGLRRAGQGGRPRRDLARQQLPGPVLRHAVAPVLVLVPALALEPALPAAARRSWPTCTRWCAERGLGPHLRFGAGVAAAEFDERARGLEPHPGGRRARCRPPRSSAPSASSAARPCPTSRAGTSSPGRRGTRPAGTTTSTWPGRRVAVIGTGASAIQFVPEIAKVAGARRRLPAHAAVRAAQGRPAVPGRRAGPVRPAARGAQGRPAAHLPLRRAAHQRLRAVAEAAGRADAAVAPPAPHADRRPGAARQVRPRTT